MVGSCSKAASTAVKNHFSGFMDNDIELARPSQPVNGFIDTDIGF
jgi:hypothetical protein